MAVPYLWLLYPESEDTYGLFTISNTFCLFLGPPLTMETSYKHLKLYSQPDLSLLPQPTVHLFYLPHFLGSWNSLIGGFFKDIKILLSIGYMSWSESKKKHAILWNLVTQLSTSLCFIMIECGLSELVRHFLREIVREIIILCVYFSQSKWLEQL